MIRRFAITFLSISALLSAAECVLPSLLTIGEHHHYGKYLFVSVYNGGGWYASVGPSLYYSMSGRRQCGRYEIEVEYRTDRSTPIHEHSIGTLRLGARWGVRGNMVCAYSGTDTKEERERASWPSYFAQIITPVWLLPIALGCYPLWCAVGVVRRRRQKHRNHCVECKYDLTGNTSGICPECGTKTEPYAGQMSVANRVMREDRDVLRKLGQ